MLGDCFAALGDEVPYRPASGGETTITVSPAAADRLTAFATTRAQSPAAVFEVLVSDLAQPEVQSEIDFKGTTYKIKSFRRKDDERLIWLLDCYPA